MNKNVEWFPLNLIVGVLTLGYSLQIPQPNGQPFEGFTEVVHDCEIDIEMVAIPGGAFTMESPADEKGRADNEGP